MEFTFRVDPDGALQLGQRNTAIFLDFVKNNPNVPWRLAPVLPESSKQRRYFEGAVVPLVAFYQDGMDHRNQEDLRRVREWLKEEFNGELVIIAGKAHRIGRSTKGREALRPFLERVLDWLVENYQPPAQTLDPGSFREWRDTIFPSAGPDNYIDYLRSIGIL
jgi:hypothetical protein